MIEDRSFLVPKDQVLLACIQDYSQLQDARARALLLKQRVWQLRNECKTGRGCHVAPPAQLPNAGRESDGSHETDAGSQLLARKNSVAVPEGTP